LGAVRSPRRRLFCLRISLPIFCGVWMIHAHAISSVLGERQVIAFKFAFTHVWSFVTSVLVGVLLSLYVSGAIGKVFCRAPTVGMIRMVSMVFCFCFRC
jgi:hypothetical protein